MSFENVYRSREGVREINKITQFIGGLIIKNNYEANKYETSESISDYFKYYSAYTSTDNFHDYADKNERMKYFDIASQYMISLGRGYTESIIEGFCKESADWLEENSRKQALNDFMRAIRIARILQYEEKNPYYRQFMGLPNIGDDWVYVKNIDVHKEAEYDLIPIHLLKEKDWPETYNYYFLQGFISDIIEANPDKTYLRFLNSGFTSFYLRNLPNYAIIKYPQGILNNNELEYFNKSYRKARTQVLLDYIDGYDSKQPLYSVAMIENLLYFTVMNYAASYIERYTVADYTDENIDDILRSHGYDKLINISDIEIKRRIVRNFNDLLSNKANNYVLELILSKIISTGNDTKNELKRYYIEKEFNINDNYQIDIDTGRGLEHSVKLVFRQVPAVSDAELTTTKEKYEDYDAFISNDNLWAGINDNDSLQMMTEKREKLKKEILSLNFTSILSKYITLSRTIDFLDAQRNLRDSLYLMLCHMHNKDSDEFFRNKITYNGIECTPAALFAAMLWLQQMKYYDNPDDIVVDQCVINSAATFKTFGRSAIDRNTWEKYNVVNGVVLTDYYITTAVLDKNVLEFFTGPNRIPTISVEKVLKYGTANIDGYRHTVREPEDMQDHMIYYRFYENGFQLGEVTANTTFGDLIKDHRAQSKPLIRRITDKLRYAGDFREYQAWLFLLMQSRRDQSIYFIFKGHKKFSEYIQYLDCANFVQWIIEETSLGHMNPDELLNLDSEDARNQARYEKIGETLAGVTEAFKNWTRDNFSKDVFPSEIDDAQSDSYVKDMIILFEEFLSTYSVLYNVDYVYSMGDRDFQDDGPQIFYAPLREKYHDKLHDYLGIWYRPYSALHLKFKDYIDLFYEWYSSQKTHLEDWVLEENLNFEYSNEKWHAGEEPMPPDNKNDPMYAVLYKEWEKLHEMWKQDKARENFGGIKFFQKFLDSLEFDEELRSKLTTNLEDNINIGYELLSVKGGIPWVKGYNYDQN